MLKAAMDENVNIISLGDLNKNVMVNLPACVLDILTVNRLTNLFVNPTHFSGNSETLIDPILVTDSIPVIDSYTMPIDRSISDHDGTYMYVTINSGYDHNISFTRDVWNYKRAHYDLMKSKIINDHFNSNMCLIILLGYSMLIYHPTEHNINT
jgi:hypothetical protein